MTRADYIAALLDLLRLLQGTLDREHDSRNANYINLIYTIEAFLPSQTVDGDTDEVRTVSNAYLNRMRYLYLKGWDRQSELCQEWSKVVLTLARGV